MGGWPWVEASCYYVGGQDVSRKLNLVTFEKKKQHGFSLALCRIA